METWEVVLILALVTVSVMVLVQKEMSMTCIRLLDNTFFQLAILTGALAVATISPAVAIVAIATIVVVFYVRNLTKIQMITPYELSAVDEDTPRIEMTEKTERTMTIVGDVPVSAGTLPDVNAPPPKDNKDVVAKALSEHESRPPMQQPLVGQRASISGTAPLVSQLPPPHENFPNPRGSAMTADPVDSKMAMYGEAPVSGFTPSIEEEEGFTAAAGYSIDGKDESSTEFIVRPFNDNQGQYNLNEVRPNQRPGKYELADFMPGTEMGSNDFAPTGVSIDDKVSNLQNGFVTSSAAPPDFNNAFPARA
jgi:hypothetical protein